MDDLVATIRRVDDTHVTMPPATIDAMMANLSAVMKDARIVPVMRSGKTEGFKVYAVRPGSLCAGLNLENGDSLLSINGHELTPIDQWLEIYSKLRTEKEFAARIMRRGQPLTLHDQITE